MTLIANNLSLKWKHVAGVLLTALTVIGVGQTIYAYHIQIAENEKLRQHIDTYETINRDNQEKYISLLQENNRLKMQLQELEQKRKEEAIIAASTFDVRVTAYDLSVESCGKPVGSHGYGITASGIDLTGHTLESARAIAVDPNLIPMGSKVELTFDKPDMQKYNGVYTAVDTGSAIKGNKIDLFFGDFGSNSESSILNEFGIRSAKARIL